MAEKEVQITEILDYYGKQRDKKEQHTIIQMLKELQEANGFLTKELKQCAADTAGVKLSLIEILVKRCPGLKEADYVHEVTVCSGERCGRKNGGELVSRIRTELGIGKDNLSRDGKILLKVQNCLKQCRTFPNFMVDGVLYSNVNPGNVGEILGKAVGKNAGEI